MSQNIQNTQSSRLQGLTTDLKSLGQLKGSAAADPKSGMKEAARQLESLFMNELIKSMRATTMNSGMMENAGTEMGTSMLDTQLSSQLSGLPGGLSDMILKQLERQMGGTQAPGKTSAPSTVNLSVQPADTPATTTRPRAEKAEWSRLPGTSAPTASERFVLRHTEAAKAAEAETGIPAAHILGQAALESGWGKRDIRMPDGSSSHNLFGIKAGPGWKGKVAEVTTTEYVNGEPRRVTAKFRAYDSFEDSFKDHARLLTQSPRYQQTVAQGGTASGYANGLQRAGYATDPQYADKLTRVINTTLRLQRAIT